MSYNIPVYREQDGKKLVLESTGQIEDQNISTVTAGTSMNNYGFTALSSTKVSALAAPTSGCQKWILMHGSTKAIKFKCPSGVTINNSTDRVFTVTHGSTKSKEIGTLVYLRGASTSKWYMGTVRGSTVQLTQSLSSTT